ncbi:hypothetical protein ACIQYQ_09700 [Pseudomonas asiatica]|uniref:hypothetical protein n=1 Tax=Pseudomonas asiatica TaxID=2219225 RepID=UPI00383BE33D
MSISKTLKVVCGGALITAMSVYCVTAQVHGGVVFMLAVATFLVGFSAGEDF